MPENEQLALFADTPASPAPDCGGNAARALPPPRPEPAPADTTAVATPRPAVLPAGCRWREVDTPLQTIGFLQRTSRRKTIGLTISDDGLIVTTPSWVPQAEVAHAIKAKAPWILRKLRAVQERQRHLATVDTRWQEGGRFPYLGAQVALAIRPHVDAPHFSGDSARPFDGDVLTLPMRADTATDRVRERVQGWLQQQAKQRFHDRLRHYCELAGVSLAGWRLASPGGRWGSCTSDGRIMLNWRLIHFPPDIVDYVVAHEVAHLRHMNHGPEFWREVGRLYPDFGRARLALRPHHPGSLPLL